MAQEGKYSEEDLKRILEAANTIDASSSRIAASFNEMRVNITSSSNALEEFSKALTQQFDLSTIEGISSTFDALVKQRSVFMGTSFKEADALRESIARGYSEIVKFGGNLNDVANIQHTMLREFNTNSMETSENVKELFLTSKLTGIETSKLVTNFREAGVGVDNMSDSMINVINYARSIGVSVQAVAGRVTEHIGKLNLYNFEGGVQGLSKMAAQASLLNIDMGKTFKLAEDLLSPEKAIELSSSLQRLGVTSSQLLDPLRAMDLAQNDPTELQNQLVELSKQFVRTKEDGTFEILPGAKRQLREVAQTLGMSAEELAGMANKASILDKKMSEITFPSDMASDEQKQLIANMARMGEGGQYVVDIKQEVRDPQTNELIRTFTETKAVSELDKDDIKMLTENSGTKTLEGLSESQLTQLESINNKITDMTTALRVAVGASQVIPQMKDVAAAAVEKQYQESKKGIETPEYTDKLLGKLGDYTNSQNKVLDQMVIDGKITTESLKNIGTNIVSAVKELGGEQFGRTIQPLVESLTKNIPGGEKISTFTEENKDTIGGILVAITTLMPSINTLTKKMDNLVTKFGSFIGLKDFIFTKGNIYSYDENDLFIGGTRLLGENQQSMSPETQKQTIEQKGSDMSAVSPTKFTETTELTTLLTETQDMKRTFKELLDSKFDLNIPNQEKIDVTANVEFENFDIPEMKNITTHVKVLYDVEELKLPEPIDLSATIKYDTEEIPVPEIKDLTGKINYQTGEMPDLSEIDTVTSKINFDLSEIPDLPKIDNINGKINYEIGNIPKKPEIDNLTASIDYKVGKLPDDLNIENLTRYIDYEIGEIPKEPELKNPTVLVNYETPDIKEIKSKINYEIGDIPTPTNIEDIKRKIQLELGETPTTPNIKDITGTINYVTGKMPNISDVEDLTAKINYELGETPKIPEIENITGIINYKTGNVEDFKIEDKIGKINYVKGEIEDFKLPDTKDMIVNVKYNVEDLKLPETTELTPKLPDTKDMIVNVKYNVEDLKLPETTELTSKVKLDIENQIVTTELSKQSLDLLEMMSKQKSEIKYETTQVTNNYNRERQVATPEIRQNVVPNINTVFSPMNNQEMKVTMGEMKVIIEIPGLNNNAETQRIAKEAIEDMFNNGTAKRNMSQMFAEGIRKTNGVLNTSGAPNYVANTSDTMKT